MANRDARNQYKRAYYKREKNHAEHATIARNHQLNAIHDRARNGAAKTLKEFRDDFIRNSNETSALLAERYGLSPSAIRMIRLRGP